MSITYKWQINRLDCNPKIDGNTDVVVTVHWDRLASDGNGHNARIYGSQVLTYNPAWPLTPYADLTEDQVIGWLEGAFGAETLAAQEAALDKQIADQINPPIVYPPLPWASSQASEEDGLALDGKA